MSSVRNIADQSASMRPTEARLRWLNLIAGRHCQTFLVQRNFEVVWLPAGVPTAMDRWLTQDTVRRMWQARGCHQSMVVVGRRYPMELTAAGEALRKIFASRFVVANYLSVDMPGRRFRQLIDGCFEVAEPGTTEWNLDLHNLHQREDRVQAPRCSVCSPQRCPASAGGCRAPLPIKGELR